MPSHRILVELTRRYCEPHRHYHGIEHVAWILHTGRELALSNEQLLAIWFHDAIYDVPGSSNEEQSAALARRLLRAEAYPEESIALVERIVLDTKEHRPSIDAAALVIDLDLAPLGVPWEEFAANSRKLEREYSSLDPADFERGRRKFFTDFLARDRIYSTDWGARWEAQARRNIERLLRGG